MPLPEALRAFLSRSGFSSPFGKVEGLGYLRLRRETKEMVRAAAAQTGQPAMEFVRELIELSFHGREEVERRHTIRLDAIEQVLPKSNTKASTE